jgi:hypothetical protein
MLISTLIPKELFALVFHQVAHANYRVEDCFQLELAVA